MTRCNVIKRDGRQVDYQVTKITQAIRKAGEATGEFEEAVASQLGKAVDSRLTLSRPQGALTVEFIQDVVEDVLLDSAYKKTAKAYILYREQHAALRAMMTQANTELVDGYLDALDWQVKENSNMAFSLQGLNSYMASELSKTYWLKKIYPPAVCDAHQSGAFHLHDLGSLSVYCVGWDLYQLLEQGFCGVPGKVASAPPKHLASALGQLVNFFFTLQGEAAGAQAFSSLDTLLAPFIRYDGLSDEQLKQELQSFVFNLNVPTRVGFQAPFTNITLDLTPSPVYKDQPVIIGGEPMPETYGEFQEEMDRFNRCFCEVMQAGDAEGRVFSFPIPTYNVDKTFDWDNPNLAALWEMTARYGIPYFANFIHSDMRPEDARSMCCRLRLDNRELAKRGGGLFGANPLTGSIGVVTLNLPQAAYQANGEKAVFFRLIRERMELAKLSLEMKRKLLEKLTAKSLYPYSKHYLHPIYERTGAYWQNHFATIGLVGMNEACLNLLGCDLASRDGTNLAEETLEFMRDLLREFQEETGHLYNLEATPAEATAYRLAQKDRKRYPAIQVANQSDSSSAEAPYYSNSTQLPVQFCENPFLVLNHQEKLQPLYTGGTVFHYFCDETLSDAMQVKQLVRRLCTHYSLPYITFTPTFSICSEHGYLKGEQTTCPHCERTTEIYSRVVGYLRPVHQWNVAKQAEFTLRQGYELGESDDVAPSDSTTLAQPVLT